jgi:hypothetical protein
VSRELRAARFASQLLCEPAADAVAVTERLLAVQAQDLRSTRLALRARARQPAPSDMDRALTAERTLVIGWLNRGTLHLVRPEDYWWLHGLTTPPLFTANARRLAQTGVTPAAAERGVSAIEGALAEEGPLTRQQLRDRLAAASVQTEGQALVHLLMLACLRGVAVRGPMVEGRHAYVLAREWLPAKPAVDRERALGELALRYLAGHAPADDRDLAKWTGLPLRDARAGVGRIARQVIERDDGLLELAGRPPPGSPRVCLLDQWDPVLVGWRSREPLLGAFPERDSPSAHYRPFAYADGRAVATWRLRGGVVTVESPFTHLSRAERSALAAEAAAVERFFRDPSTEVRHRPARGN